MLKKLHRGWSTKSQFWKIYTFVITMLLVQNWYGCSEDQNARRIAYEKNKTEYEKLYKRGEISKSQYQDFLIGNDEFFKR